MEQVKETLQWPYLRFTGILFQRLPITVESPDGIPEDLRSFQRKADYKFIDVPPGVLLRAKKKSSVAVDSMGLRLCALFETYGIEAERLQELQRLVDESEEDSERQIRAWSDVGQCMRTETDLANRTGAELFVEDPTDMFE